MPAGTVALLNIVPLRTIICGGNTQDRSVISRYSSHQSLTQVVQNLARLRYEGHACQLVLRLAQHLSMVTLWQMLVEECVTIREEQRWQRHQSHS
jgi:hypothetical protein